MKRKHLLRDGTVCAVKNTQSSAHPGVVLVWFRCRMGWYTALIEHLTDAPLTCFGCISISSKGDRP